MNIEIEIKEKRVFDAINSIEDLILYKTFIEPSLNHHIIIVFIEGKSGAGKSMTSVSLAERLENLFSRIVKIDIKYDVIKQVIYTPGEYSYKVDQWTKSKYITLAIDELRQLVSARKWYTLLSQSIAEANATLRAIKVENCGYGGILIYNSQDLGDITKDVRKTIHYDIILERKEQVQMHIYTFWNDRSNVEKPILRLKRLELPFGDYVFKISTSIMTMPSTEVKREFIKHSIEAKSKILKRKREIILREIKRELGEIRDFRQELQVDEIFEMVKNLASFSKRRGVYFTTQNAQIIMKMFDLSKAEFKKEFLPCFIEEVKRRGLI